MAGYRESGTRNDSYAEQVFTHLALSAGASEFNKDGEVVFNSPNTVRTLGFYKELSHYTPPGPQWWRGRDFYMQGRLAMMFYSTFIMDDLAIPSIAANSLGPNHFKELDGTNYD
ncbi:extracellular solute-binding protein, partial [Aduncisulcus paluster]